MSGQVARRTVRSSLNFSLARRESAESRRMLVGGAGSATGSGHRLLPRLGVGADELEAVDETGAVLGHVASEMRAFQISRSPKVSSTGLSRSFSTTSPPVLRMRMTTIVSRSTTRAMSISSGSACPSASPA